MSKQTDPSTREEWQNAVDAANGMLALDSARKYGLVTGGPTVNIDRCEEILRRGQSRGIRPSAGSIERTIGELLAEEKRR